MAEEGAEVLEAMVLALMVIAEEREVMGLIYLYLIIIIMALEAEEVPVIAAKVIGLLPQVILLEKGE